MATIRVSNQNQLNNALRNVDDGDTILLASGNYSKLEMSGSRRNDFDFSQTVTIKSENADRPAVINRVFLNDASNIKIADVKMDYNGSAPSGTPNWLRSNPFTLQNTKNITFDDVTFDGHRNGAGFGMATGLYVKQSKGFTMTDSEMTTFHTAIKILNSQDTALKGNSVRQMNFDGLQIAGAKGLVIEDNYLGNYRSQDPKAAHKDNIQFYTGQGAGASQDVVIRGNTLDSSDSRHGIFMFNEMYRDGNTSNAVRHKNILIEDNYINSTNVHGITVVQAEDVTIRDNTVLHNKGMGFPQIPLINVSLTSRDVEITGNTVYSVQKAANSTWTVSGNKVQAQSKAHFEGVYKNGAEVKNASASKASTFAMVEDNQAEVFQVHSKDFDSGKTQVIDDLDFSDGDQLILTGFDAGTFEARKGFAGVSLWDDGGSVRITSEAALREVVIQADEVTARASADKQDLFVYIDHPKTDVATLHLVDYLV